MYGQTGAVTGLRKRPSYTDIINAETPYLPARKQARDNKEFADKTFKFNEEQALIDTRLADEAAHDARKAQNRAQNLSYANLGLTALGQTDALSDLYNMVMSL